MNVERALSFNAGFEALGDKLRAGGSAMLDIIIQQKLIAKTPYEIMHYSSQDI